MRISKPAYYDNFRCIASACPDSCCKEWDVQIDEEAAEKYRALPGALGDRLRKVMAKDENGETVMTIVEGRCPMWQQDGLCRIQTELGESALCKVCREFPRIRHDYGSFVELGLELSCPEAARMILTSIPAQRITVETGGGEEAEYDREAMEVLLKTREEMLGILGQRNRPLNETLAICLMYGYHAQELLDGGENALFDAEAALSEAGQFAVKADISVLPAFYAKLEILTEAWSKRLSGHRPGGWTEPLRAFACYCVERYWLQAVSDYDLISRVKMIIGACLLIHQLGGDSVATAQLYSKEIENSAENVDAILDAAYADVAFADNKLLGWLLL